MSQFDNTWTPGFLERIEDRDTIDYLSDVRSQLRTTMLKTYEPNKLSQQTEFNAICLRQLNNSGEDGKDIVRIIARIPELHTMIPIPKNEDDFLAMSLYPVYTSANNFNPKVVSDSVEPGTRMVVSYQNYLNFGGPTINKIFNIQNGTGEGPEGTDRRRKKRPKSRAGAWPSNFKKKCGKQQHASPKKKIKRSTPSKPWKPGIPITQSVVVNGNLAGCEAPKIKGGEKGKNKWMPKLQGGPVGDGWAAILKECASLGGNMLHLGSGTRWKYNDPEPCKSKFASYHGMGRAIDIFPLTGMYRDPSSSGVDFLVTLSPMKIQTKALLADWTKKFFKYSVDKAGFTVMNDETPKMPAVNPEWQKSYKFTLWLKASKGTEVQLQVAKCSAKASKCEFNANKFVQWKGKAINFTQILKKHGWYQINPYSHYKRGFGKFKDPLTGNPVNSMVIGKNRKGKDIVASRFVGGDNNESEWHHVQTNLGLNRGDTLGQQYLNMGYDLQDMQASWGGQGQAAGGTVPNNWDYYSKLKWTGRRWQKLPKI